MTHVLAAVALTWSAVVACVAAVAIFRAFLSGVPPAPRLPFFHRPVVLVRPCAGDEPWLEETLVSVTRARKTFPLAVRLALGTAEDTAAPAAHRAIQQIHRAGMDARVVITHAQGPNHKSAQLARALVHDDTTLVIVADSDVDLTDTNLDALVAPFANPAVAAVWCPPVETHPRTVADRASAAILGGSLHSFTLLKGIDRGGLVGKLMALRSDALHAVGGFEDLTRHLGEDMELARRFHARGWTVVALGDTARARVCGRGWSTVVGRYARWLAVIRAQRTGLLASYPLLFASTPWIVALALAGLPGSPRVGVAALTVAVVTRLAVAVAAARAAGLRPSLVGAVTDAVLADMVLTLAFLRAATRRTLSWRGRPLVIEPGGTLREAQPVNHASARSAMAPSGSDGARSTVS